MVTTVTETGYVASEIERQHSDYERHERERNVFCRRLEEQRKAAQREPGEDRGVISLLNSWDEERAIVDGELRELELLEGVAPEGAAHLAADDLALAGEIERELDHELRYRRVRQILATARAPRILYRRYCRKPDEPDAESVLAKAVAQEADGSLAAWKAWATPVARAVEDLQERVR